MELLSQNQRNKAERSKGSWAKVSILQEGRMEGISQLSPLKEKLQEICSKPKMFPG